MATTYDTTTLLTPELNAVGAQWLLLSCHLDYYYFSRNSENVAGLIDVLILTLDPVVRLVLVLLFARGEVQRQLVEVMEHVVVFDLDLRVVAHRQSRRVVSVNLIPGYLREAAPAGDDARSLVLVDLVVRDQVATVEQNDAVAVVVDHVVLDPAEAGLNAKDALASRLIDQVVQDDRVRRVVAAISDVRLVVLEDLILLDVARGRVHEQNTLAVVREDQVVEHFDGGSLSGTNARLPIVADVVILLDAGVVFLALDVDAGLEVLLNPVVADYCIRPQVILGRDVDTVLVILPDLVHHDVWVCRERHNADFALGDVAELDLAPGASLDFDARALDISDHAAKHLSLAVHALQINAYQAARADLAVLNNAAVFSFRDDMHGSLFEVGERAIGDLDVRINRDGTTSLIRFIADELTANKVQRRLREAHQSGELLLEALRDRLERQHTLTQDNTAGVQADDAVHVAADFKFFQRLHAGLWSVFDVLHGLQNVFEQLDTGVGERNPFEVDQLTLLELHVDDRALVAHNYNLSVLILLLDRQARLRDRPLACIDTLC